MGLTPRSTSACAEKWTPPLAPRFIGRRTFDLGLGPWGGTPWPGMPSVVVTHRVRQDLLGNNGGMFAFDGLEAAVRRAKQAAGHKDVLVLGADIARQLLRAGLLDEVRRPRLVESRRGPAVR
jgi:dihydrofolate reductase